MRQSENVKDYIYTVLNNVKEDHSLVYAVIIDSLYRWEINNFAINSITEIISTGHTLNSKKLNGIVLALIEYQQKKYISKKTVSALMRLVEQRIYEEDISEGQWITNFLILLENQFTIDTLEWLFDLILDKNRIIPNYYRKKICELINKYIAINSKNTQLVYIIEAKKKDLKLLIKNDIIKSKNIFSHEKLEQIRLLRSCTKSFIRRIPLFVLNINLYYHLLFLNIGYALGFLSVTTTIVSGIGYYIWEVPGAIYSPAIYVTLYLIFLGYYHFNQYKNRKNILETQ